MTSTTSTIVRCAACFGPIILTNGLGNTEDTWEHADMLSVIDGHDAVGPVARTVAVTAIEQDALDFIARVGGSLPGGRQNTRTTDRLIAKGLVRLTYTASRVEVTTLGIAHVTPGTEIA